MSYEGLIRAEKGSLLLGGVPRVISSRFKTSKSARLWLDAMVKGNKDAGRNIETAIVLTRPNKRPEIDE